MPKNVKKWSKSRIDEHIKSLISGKRNIDKILEKASREIFPLEEKTLYVLSKISENSLIHEYAIGKINAGYCDRFVVRRRLPYLLDNEFIRSRSSEEFRNTGKEKISYSCTLKGILAALQLEKFERIGIVDEYFNEIRAIVKPWDLKPEGRTKNALISAVIKYIKNSNE